MIKLLEQQVDLVLQIMLPLSFSGLEGRAPHFCILPISGSDTVRSICDLGRKGRVGDCLMLARSVLEWSVNYCFLLVCDEEHATAFEQHSKQRQFRNLNRSLEVGQMGIRSAFSATPDPSRIEGLQEAIDAFTSRKGKVITHWSPLHLHDRISIFAERSKVNALSLLSLAFWVYDDASEILHGTLYGSLAGQGIHLPQATDVAKALEGRNGSLSLMAFMMMSVLDVIIQVTAEQVDLDRLGVAHLSKFSADKTRGVAETLREYLSSHDSDSGDGPTVKMSS